MEGERTNDQNNEHSDDEQPELHKDVSNRFNQIDNVLFISNLNYLTSEQEIEYYFHDYHTKFIQVLVNEMGQSRGSALVEFENSDQAIAAMNELNGTEICDRQIKIQKAAKKDIQSYRKFEMKNLIRDINDECEYQKYNLFVLPINSVIENLTKLVVSNATQINNNATQIKDLSAKIDKVITHLEDFADGVRKNQKTLFNAINHNPIELAETPILDKQVKKI